MGNSTDTGAGAPTRLAFVDQPQVRFGGQTSDFGGDSTSPGSRGGCYIWREREVSADAARALGFDVDGDLRSVEQDVLEDVRILRQRADGDALEWQTTELHLRARIERFWRSDREPPRGVALTDAVPPDCPPTLTYEMLVQLFTADGAIAGTFFANREATPVGEDPAAHDGGYASVDLRNFSGTLPIPVVAGRIFFANASINWWRQVQRPFELNVAAVVWSDVGYLGFDSVNGLLLSGDSALGIPPDGNVLDLGNDRIFVLDELLASWVPERPSVRLGIVALEAEPSSVHVRARVNDELLLEEDRTLVAQPDLTAAAVGDWIDLGQLDEGTRVDFEVENLFGLSDIRSRIAIDGCEMKRGEDRCREDGCLVRRTFQVTASPCGDTARP